MDEASSNSRASDESRRPSRDSGPSSVDEIDDWGAAKKSTTFGGGFDRRDRGERGRKEGFLIRSLGLTNRTAGCPTRALFRRLGHGDSVQTAGGLILTERGERRWGFESNGGGGGADSEDRWGKKEITGTGGAFDSLRERRGGVGGGGDLDNWKREEGSETAAAVKPKGSNPFGNARPSEENLKEKGHDWKEVDENFSEG
ncbi:hypothetical protein RJ639_036110 [Escallonia herrerae]|uniref:Uncharacterized protein n=1 Tax=Escallonia herrerae TaxID=1293975 RepID=A0AA89B7Q2_9ASTE|nr:hypothetical protein RJ639_036110 [Escallonia herrerae]